jgi:hypothetical protein
MRFARTSVVAALCGAAFLAACSEPTATRSPRHAPAPQVPVTSVAAFDCVASTQTRTLSCGGATLPAGARGIVYGGQNFYVKLTSTNVSYNAQTDTFQFDVTVQNLLNETIGTPDGVVADSNGIRVFFADQPQATSGEGTITVANPDGTDAFTGIGQPYFRYDQILAKNAVSNAKTWKLFVPNTVDTFTFRVYISTEVQTLLVINELLANPGGTITDANGEWVELYNAGTLRVQMQGLVFADSAASGRRPYNVFGTSYIVQPGAYIVLGATTNTTLNGGVPVDYAYGSGMAFANSLDAFKIARVYGTDTLTIDRTQYSQASTSAQDGVSRELKNPALDNSNMDGSNWGSASVTSIYGPGGRGTPKAQNSDYTP